MIELTTAIFFLASSIYGGPSTAIAQDVENSANTHKRQPVENPVTLEDYVRAYFIETPILAEIASCESSFRQYGEDGDVLRG